MKRDHLYNVGGFLFAFTVFWSYIGFAQYLLMWYGNMPEEIVWYKERIQGPWLGLVLLVVLLNFIIPFFALIPRDAKGAPRRLRWVAALMLFGHFVDLYWLIFPALGRGVLLSWPEVSFALFFGGAALLWVRTRHGPRAGHARGRSLPQGRPGVPPMIDRYVSPEELRRLVSALLVVVIFICIVALFAFLIVPGMRNANQPERGPRGERAPGRVGLARPHGLPRRARVIRFPPWTPRPS